MVGIIFILLVIASGLLIATAWIFALRQNYLAEAWIEQTGRRALGPIPLNVDKGRTGTGRRASGR